MHQLQVLDPRSPVPQLPDLVELAAAHYEEALQTELKNYHIKQLFTWYTSGLSHDVVLIAMQQTFEAPAPSWRYLSAILNACIAEKCFTLNDWQARNERYKRSKTRTGRRVSAQEYAQRPMDENALEADTAALLRAARAYENE